jgi:hypothetical protein
MIKEFEVIIDLGSKTFRVFAEDCKSAKEKAMERFEKLPVEEKIEEYWIAECTEVSLVD